ncbi:hypothetical protein HER15_04625 [Tenacibaculum mesophilum]|uniref:DUF5018 domain-containing protein n=1 Tax=Tenacibaculum mesophilum TaxID=104268 RepID=A0AAE9MMJ2_9FLAO|nr:MULTISPECIES: DUF5018 domain-containing protein [Tenacibaculum]KAF9658239.1 hypothetical protein HBA12_13625 [Tenacibaculum mesophilum]MCO7186684.1 DUF5018 domain-containing protein [Tenacibaculum sp. XPcli2-G]UTD14809.1 hypothetical protein HER15_04625 [Tenacibaculum mesophilum]
MIKKIISITFTILMFVSCSKDDEPESPIILSSESKITSFTLKVNDEVINGNIDQTAKTIVFNVVGAEISALTPSIEYSTGATISPLENESQNFNNEVPYTVYAENGETSIYRVQVNNRPLSSENKILSFSVILNNQTIDAEINQDSNIISFNTGELDISSLTPTISISEYASISPNNSNSQNFETPVTYTVTAENGEQREYKVIANMPVINNYRSYYLYYIRANMVISGKFIDPSKPGAEIYLTDGTNKYYLPILNYESYSSQERVTTFNINTKIPENIPTNTNYKIIYKTNLVEIESDQFIDILAENAPKIISTNQNSYSYGDNLIITGENLTDYIGVPSNGSFYQFNPNGSIDATLNPEKTEYNLLMDGSFVRSAFFNNNLTERTVIFIGSEGRMGDQININVNN